MKGLLKKAINICVFIAIANLPFMGLVQIMGMDTFLDSFENSDSYLFLGSNEGIVGTSIDSRKGIFIQKSSHPDYSLNEGDTVIYYQSTGEIVCDRIDEIKSMGFIEKYSFADNENQFEDAVYKYQIVGKVISVVDDNALNEILMKIWDISINNLNINSLVD